MNNKQHWRFHLTRTVFVLVLVLAISLTGSVYSKADETKPDASGKRTFTVGFDAEFPPYGFKNDDGEYVGFDLDLAAEVCKRQGWELKKQPIDWDSKDFELDSGSIDCIWNGFTINGREKLYTWSKAYVDNSQVVIVKNKSKITKLSDLKKKVVAVQADSSALAAFTGEDATEENIALCKSFQELQQVSDYNSAFLNLESGSVDAICMDIGVAAYQIKNRGDAFRMLDEQVSSEQYGVGFKKGNTALRDKVQASLDEMLEDGTFEEIAAKWELTDCVCLGNKGTDSAYLLDADTNSNNQRTFTVGFDAEFPPYGYKNDDGEYVGFDLDLAAEVCKRQGWELKKQPIDWDSKDLELESGSIDCIWNGFTINGREESYTWSKAYVDNSQVVIVKNNSKISKLSDLKKKVVAVQADSSALAAFTSEDATEENIALCKSFKELQQVSDYNSAFLNLESGSVDAICMDIGVAAYQIKNRGDTFRMLDEQVSSEQYGVGFKKGNTALRNKVQASLDEMLEDGTFAEIAAKWELTDCVCLGNEGTDSAYRLDDQPQTKEPVKKERFVDTLKDIGSQLSDGMLRTFMIFLLSLLFSLPLGLLVCALRMSRFLVIRWISRIYISIMRGTPLMLQLLVVFFGPYYLFGVTVSSSFRFAAVIIGFSLNYAAYFAEIFRAGIESIPVGQREAAAILGYSRIQTFWKIIFPQMVRNTLPAVTNEVITLVKDTSLAFALAYTEMFTMAKQIAASKASIMPLFVAGLFYYIFNFIIAMIMEKIEKKMQYY